MRGTFIFPENDRDFLQQLEMRGNNGGVETVETVYIIAGSTYFVPERLFAVDDPDLYYVAEQNRVRPRRSQMMRQIYEFYESGPEPVPRMLMDVHTHPTGRTTPSDGDREVAARIHDEFDYYFDDYEFFLGIHGLGEECTPDPRWMRVPRKTGENEISWWGENRKHSLAVYDGAYEPRPVMVTTAAELQQQLQRQRRQARQEAEPEPRGEIWD